MPAAVREQMNLKQGDQLIVDFNRTKQSATVRKAMTIDELSAYLTSKIPSGTEPLKHVDEYYQKHRGKHIR